MEKGYFICVDDEVSVLETLREQLRQYFGDTHEVEIAASAEDALNLIDEITGSGGLVELIISDQVMPGMKGDRFLEEIHKRLPDAIKVLLTGQAGLDSAIHAINFGGLNRYIEKPWNMQNLRSDIEDMINKFRQNLENQRLLINLEKKVSDLERENESLRAKMEQN